MDLAGPGARLAKKYANQAASAVTAGIASISAAVTTAQATITSAKNAALTALTQYVASAQAAINVARGRAETAADAAEAALDSINDFTHGPQGMPGSGNLIGFSADDFGAVGDGVTNDTVALNDLAAAVMVAGGGVVDFTPGATYLVGIQTFNGTINNYLFDPHDVLKITGCNFPLILRGNGCKIKCADDLKFGSFNADGTVRNEAMPFTGDAIASPYKEMIHVADCTGFVHISGFELDGNCTNLEIGGQWGDTGRQIPCTGLYLKDNTGGERVEDVESHHHCLDGWQLNGVSPDAGSLSTMGAAVNVNCHHNGRQGQSVVGGAGWTYDNCKFGYTGKDTGFAASAPAAGVDIEGEGGKVVHDMTYRRCEFFCNSGAGLIADQGASENITFEDSRFIGDTNWAAWADNPRYRFVRCTFIGALTHLHPNSDPDLAARFEDCRFLDDPALSPTGLVYGGSNPNKPILDLGTGDTNVRFTRSRFDLTHAHSLPYTGEAIYDDCVMTQVAATAAYPRGHYKGVNFLDTAGSVDLTGNPQIEGDLIINGASSVRKSESHNFGTVGAGASAIFETSFSMFVPDSQVLARLDPLIPNFSIKVYPNIDGNARVVITNETGSSVNVGTRTVHMRRFYLTGLDYS